MKIKSIILYGHTDCCEKAKFLLEDLSYVRRADMSVGEKTIKLFLDESIDENTLIPLLSNSGISGFRVL